MRLILFPLLVLFFTACDKPGSPIHNNQTVPASDRIEVIDIAKRVDEFNDAFKYDSALMLLQKLKHSNSDSLSYICFVLESQTYKRLFKYDNVMQCLDSAHYYAVKCPFNQNYLNTIAAERAFALFDTKRYEQADSLMQALRKNQFRGLTNQQIAFFIMQEGALEFQDKHYEKAEASYKEAIQIISIENKEDLPVIYGKQIKLYLEQNNDSAAFAVFNKAWASADSSGILKYKIYVSEIMRRGFRNREDYKAAYRFNRLSDSLKGIYNSQEHINKLTELETKYQTQQKEQALISSRNKQIADQRLIAFLFTALISLSLIIILVFLFRRQRKAQHDKQIRKRFTAQLFQKTEEERKRIAVDLHDGISHELLQLKEQMTSPQKSRMVDHIIDEVRSISRNLHPAMFERVGLTLSVEQLAERIEDQHDFMISLELAYTKQLTSAIELQIYRIIQESLNNVLKHANAHAAYISLKTIGNYTELLIKDNGSGFAVAEKINNASSFGIHNIIERTEAIGGKIRFESGSTGTTILINIPNNNK